MAKAKFLSITESEGEMAMAERMGFPFYDEMDVAPPQRSGPRHATIYYSYGPYSTANGTAFLGLQNAGGKTQC